MREEREPYGGERENKRIEGERGSIENMEIEMGKGEEKGKRGGEKGEGRPGWRVRRGVEGGDRGREKVRCIEKRETEA